MLIAGVDVGGTNVQIGLVDDDHTVRHRAKTSTPTGGPMALVDTITELIESLEDDVGAVGVGIPGAIHEGEVVYVPNLQGWSDTVDLRSLLGERTGVPVALGNDANVGLLGEWIAGAARGRDNVVGVWIGTGIGGGLILDGRPYTGALGAAGELGHVIVHAGGAMCTCGRRGCVESYAGRRSMAAAAAAMVDAGRSTRLFDIQRDEGKERPTSKVWAEALDAEDQLATDLFDSAIEALGAGIGTVVNLLDVEQVVVGGGMAEKLGQDLADRIADSARPWMLHPSPHLSFDVAELGDDSGVVGAAALGRAKLLGK